MLAASTYFATLKSKSQFIYLTVKNKKNKANEAFSLYQQNPGNNRQN